MEKTILIADDEPGHVSTLAAFLRERGYRVVVARDGEEAVSMAFKHRPNLIILDIMMPRMDGTDAAMMLRHDDRTSKIPIFFLTAVITAADEPDIKGNPNSVFAKPVKYTELLDAIRKIETAP